MKIHAEIEYKNKDGLSIHSDICPPNCQDMSDAEYRKIIHQCLDEWLDNSKGTGGMYIKNENHNFEFFKDPS